MPFCLEGLESMPNYAVLHIAVEIWDDSVTKNHVAKIRKSVILYAREEERDLDPKQGGK